MGNGEWVYPERSRRGSGEWVYPERSRRGSGGMGNGFTLSVAEGEMRNFHIY